MTPVVKIKPREEVSRSGGSNWRLKEKNYLSVSRAGPGCVLHRHTSHRACSSSHGNVLSPGPSPHQAEDLLWSAHPAPVTGPGSQSQPEVSQHCPGPSGTNLVVLLRGQPLQIHLGASASPRGCPRQSFPSGLSRGSCCLRLKCATPLSTCPGAVTAGHASSDCPSTRSPQDTAPGCALPTNSSLLLKEGATALAHQLYRSVNNYI